jgi:hypothetical protein
MPWPIASLASSGINAFNSAFERSWSRKACRVSRNKSANSAQEFERDDPDGFDPRLWRFNAEQMRGLATLDTAPELALGRDHQMLIERIGMGGDLDPFAAAGDH